MAIIKRIGSYGEYYGNEYNSSNSLNLEQMKLNARYISNSLLDYGWSLESISAMLGNMQIESSINPGRWQGDNVGTGPAYGIVQWDPFTKYTNWASERGFDPSTMDSNLSRINYEVENNIQWIPTSIYRMTFQEFKTSNISPKILADIFLKNYERPANPNQPIRGENALYWYKYLGGTVKESKRFKWAIYSKLLRKKRTNV